MALFTRVIKNDEEEFNLPQEIIKEEPIINEPARMSQNQSQIKDNDWLDSGGEGQLSVDVFQTPENVIIKSTIAGVKPEEIDIAIDNDMVTIRGERKREEEINENDYFYQECYWGAFSRSVALPVEVNAEESEAILKNGVLTLILPKAHKTKSIAVKVKGE
jgi:HSP20 family protein